MYKIQSIKSGKVILGDLGLVLSKGDIIDLDLRFPRAFIDASINLATAIDQKAVAVLHKDVFITKEIDPKTVRDIEQHVRDTLKKEMQQEAPEVKETTIIQPAKDSELHKKLDSLLSKPGQTDTSLHDKLDQLLDAIKNIKPVVVQQGPVKDESDSIDVKVDDDKLVDIHSKAVQRLTKGAEGHVDVTEQVTESDAQKRASELENLL